ncbi:MAG: hypothetical protein HXX08_03760 [Chloroflexi bacterium]|uniref:Lamin tail domain-containing protein n=1 Tax=Candidatus Chlorohelix allophototropha TaxID=3003348 RepID=A0A8T7LSH2_9CHLR|nr:hypothetical protein [Chloroflexota bacterium]WJW66855.1 hypothetical protein OZ401_000100 [Chloroflexota bacterium L227-S17]
MKHKKRLPYIIAMLMVLVMGLAACGELTPSGNTTGFLLNEVYSGSAAGGLQWVEILANASGKDGENSLDLTGLTLRTAKGSLDLSKQKATALIPTKSDLLEVGQGKPVPGGAYLLVVSSVSNFKAAFPSSKAVPFDGSSVLGDLDPKDDAITLLQGGQLLDQVGWGNPSQSLLNKIGVSGSVNLSLSSIGGDNPKSLGRTPPTGARDVNKPGIFTIHESVSPGGAVPQPREKYNFLLNEATNVITIVGGLILFLVFVMIAVIARRFETLAQQRTYWQLLLLAPIGIMVYNVVTILAFISRGSLNDQDRWIGFTSLFISGIACAAVINVFRNIAKDILAAE